MRLDEATFTVFDFETTGLYPYSGDRICEIGALRVNFEGKEKPQFHSLVNPLMPISRGAFAVNGITDDMVKDEPVISDILPRFIKFIEGSVLVAYNAGFDLGFLEAALGADSRLLEDYRIIDALMLARKLFPDMRRYNLVNVADTLGIDSQGKHRALADAVMTARVFKKELNILISKGARTVEDIADVRRRGMASGAVKDYKLKLIENAIREQKRLNITYRSSWNNKTTRRVITPKQIQRGYDKVYVVAHCHLKGEDRNFRMDGIIEAEVTR